MRLTRCIIYCLIVVVLHVVTPAMPVEIWTSDDGQRSHSFSLGLKWSSLLSFAPDDPLLYPERWSGTGLFRCRLELASNLGTGLNTRLAYEQRARLVSEDAGVSAFGALPSDSAYWRIDPLDWSLVEVGNTFAYGHEIDRAFAAFHPEWGEVTIGRQAIGLGRGTLFGAVDVFAPFSPVEVDREWRRGVDALRIEKRLGMTSSIELIAAFGPTWEESALLSRARGYFGNVDAELIIGKRAEDIMYAATFSRVVGEAEVHMEMALFDTPEAHPDGGLFGSAHVIGKAVLGSSYTFDVGSGLTLMGEYHYSGFGVEDIGDVVTRLSDPVFQERYLRGDIQILGQHAVGFQLSWPINERWSASLLFIGSPADGSGLASPTFTWDFAQNVTLLFSAFAPWGAEPSGGDLNSEYGANPWGLFLQANIYY